MKYNCIIIEDELKSIQLLKHFLRPFNEILVLDAFQNVTDAYTFMKNNKIDFIFLDIELPSIRGTEFAKDLPYDVKIIFCTAHSKYALEAFSLGVFDYIMKPFVVERINETIAKLLVQMKLESQILQSKDSGLPSFFIKKNKQNNRVFFRDIVFLKSEEDYILINTVQDFFIIKKTMKKIIEELDDTFIRVHKSYAININRVESYTNKTIKMVNSIEIPIGRVYKSEFQNKINRTY